MAERPTLFVDRSLGKGVARRLREAGAVVEMHDDHFPQTTPDTEWIPEVARRGWVVLTKDKNIRRRQDERTALLLAKSRVFTLSSGNMSGAKMAELFTTQLREIEQIATVESPPFLYIIGRDGLSRSPLRPLPETPDEKPESQGETSETS